MAGKIQAAVLVTMARASVRWLLPVGSTPYVAWRGGLASAPPPQQSGAALAAAIVGAGVHPHPMARFTLLAVAIVDSRWR